MFLNILDPAYQAWIKKGIAADIDGGTDGISIDEHQGTVGAIWSGEGPCDQISLSGFRAYLQETYTADQLKSRGVKDIASFDYCKYIVENNYRDQYKNDQGKVPFLADYRHYLYAASDAALGDLISYAREYASQKGRTLTFGANFEPLERMDEAKIFDQLDLFIFEHDWFPIWRRNPGYYSFPAGSPVGPDMRYVFGRGKTAVSMYIIADAKSFQAQGQHAATFLVNHQFAESYANRGYYMYFDIENFLGLNFMADRTMMVPYYAFIRKYPQAFTDLTQKNSLAVILPPHINTASTSHKEYAFAVSATLAEANLQHDFIDLDKIGNYQVVVANGAAWSDDEVNRLLVFVEKGGTVIAYDNQFASQDENYQSKSRAKLGGLKTGGTHTLGKGKFIFFPEDMGWQLWAYQKASEKEKLVGAIKKLVLADRAPENVQVIPYTSGERMVMHILNYDFQNQDFVQKNDLEIQVHIPQGFPADAKVLTIVSPEFDGVEYAEQRISDGVITFTVPSLHIWDVAILE